MTGSILNYIVFFSGIFMVLLALIFLMKNKDIFYFQDSISLEEKEKRLLEYIEIAEEIILELNTINNQIIETIDKKTAEMCSVLENVDAVMKNKNTILAEEWSCNNKDLFIERLEDAFIEEKKDEVEFDPNTVDKKEEIYILETNEILDLYNRGFSTAQIAKQTNKGIGEVELMLHLKKR